MKNYELMLEALTIERSKDAEVLKKPEYAGIFRLLTDLYPDKAHFIYELLQNAEDTKATEVHFKLTDSKLEFSHNGKRMFEFKDIESITSIGNSTKRDEATSIGKFGVGFKAVFAYTNTPEIHSGAFHFRIRDLVVPDTENVEQLPTDKEQTRFVFPFNNPNKLTELAVEEVMYGLNDLGDNTLLFLNHIRKISYELPDGSQGLLQRIDHDNGRIEIQAKHPHRNDATVSHWLHFQKDVDVIDDGGKTKKCTIAIAYSLVEETNKAEEKSWKIVPIEHGQVSIYFPAEKETSKLRFHIHAPFASTVARDSVRDCQSNGQLRDHLAELIVESLTDIRDQGMLTVSFLAVLPNPGDNLSDFYGPIREAIVEAFKTDVLTPMKRGGHAAARSIFKGSASISDVIDDDDLVLLLNNNHEAPMWASNPPQRHQREDKFLESLEIEEWSWAELVSMISSLNWKCVDEYDSEEFVETWVSGKDDIWLMGLYALLGEASDKHNECAEVFHIPIIRVSTTDGDKHVKPSDAYFLFEENISLPTANIQFVKPTVYASGRSESQKRYAQAFLKSAGVSNYDLKAAVQRALKYSYCKARRIDDNYYEDLKLFISYFKNNPSEQSLFKDKDLVICLTTSAEGKPQWAKLADLYLDEPYLKTGLAELTAIHGKKPVWAGYREKLSESLMSDFVEFAQAIGVMYKLNIIKLNEENAKENPNNPYKHRKWTHTGCAQDYSIPELEKYLTAKKISASHLVWNGLINAPKNAGIAFFRPNQQYRQETVDSQLVYHLKKHAWIPNSAGEFCTPQAMTRDALRDDFPFDNGNGLLEKIGFGENAKNEALKQDQYARHSEYQGVQKNSEAQKLGFKSAEQAEQFAKLAKHGFSPEEWLAQQKRTEQPEESVPNPQRRRKGILERSENAPSKESVMRERSIQLGIGNVVAEAKAYLRTKYTNTNRETICQYCQNEMPFKVGDAYYFEAVQCVKTIENHHIENRLALCPTCAAKYQYAREADDDEIRRLITEHEAADDATSVEIPVTLAGKQHKIRFVGTHWFDLKTVLEKTD